MPPSFQPKAFAIVFGLSSLGAAASLHAQPVRLEGEYVRVLHTDGDLRGGCGGAVRRAAGIGAAVGIPRGLSAVVRLRRYALTEAPCPLAPEFREDGTHAVREGSTLFRHAFVTTDLRLEARIPSGAVEWTGGIGGGRAWSADADDAPYATIDLGFEVGITTPVVLRVGFTHHRLATEIRRFRETWAAGTRLSRIPDGTGVSWVPASTFALGLRVAL